MSDEHADDRFKQAFADCMGDVERAFAAGDIKSFVICVVNGAGEAEHFNAVHLDYLLQTIGCLCIARSSLEHLAMSNTAL